MVYSEYTWIFVLSCIVSFLVAFGIGANDLANSFGSSVGSKALKMWQAVIIAAVCEFMGAFFLGASVTDTVKSGVVNVSQFATVPGLFLYGFFAAMCAAALWDNLACYLEFPVSTTHTTIGAIMGMALVLGGVDGVTWWQRRSGFPYVRGFVLIVMSWVISPVCAFLAVSFGYFILRTFVLRSKHSFILSFWLLPAMVGFVCGIITGFIIQVGSKNGAWKEQGDGKTAWISTVVAVGTALFTLIAVMPVLKRKALDAEQRLQKRLAELQSEKDAAAAKGAEEGDIKGDGSSDGDKMEAADMQTMHAANDGRMTYDKVPQDMMMKAMHDIDVVNAPDWSDKLGDKVSKTAFGQFMANNFLTRRLIRGLFYDVHEAVRDDSRVAHVWANAEVFDFKTERLYRYLQVFSAMAMSFAHGSNDVANAMGPFAAVYYTWSTGAVPKSKTNVPDWILAVGGAGIVCGLALYGYRIMRVLGVKAVKLTNCRGFVCETATALVVVIASRFGLPVSTTQVICGAILSMGLWEGKRGVNWFVAAKILCGWVLTVIVACGVSALITALGVFTPNKPMSYDVWAGTNVTLVQSRAQLRWLNMTANATGNSTLQGLANTLSAQMRSLNSSNVRYSNKTSYQQAATFLLYNSTVFRNITAVSG